MNSKVVMEDSLQKTQVNHIRTQNNLRKPILYEEWY